MVTRTRLNVTFYVHCLSCSGVRPEGNTLRVHVTGRAGRAERAERAERAQRTSFS